ncbi:MAG: hypothetical protein H7095_09330 [Pseudopedobacter sp.]|nr:hypothetical protein [Deinococcales bacterium]
MPTPFPGPLTLEREGPYTWLEVNIWHGGRRGVRKRPDGTLSLLLDYGLSGYLDYWEGDVLRYLGDGATGDQQLTPTTLLMLEALKAGTACRVWERIRPNVWYDLGRMNFVAVRQRELGGRRVFEFDLVIQG